MKRYSLARSGLWQGSRNHSVEPHYYYDTVAGYMSLYHPINLHSSHPDPGYRGRPVGRPGCSIDQKREDAPNIEVSRDIPRYEWLQVEPMHNLAYPYHDLPDVPPFLEMLPDLSTPRLFQPACEICVEWAFPVDQEGPRKRGVELGIDVVQR